MRTWQAGGVSEFVAETAPTGAAPFCILSIDGGGLRGLIPALILQRIETAVHEADQVAGRPRQPLTRHFDLIAGTSTGALLAVGLSGPGTDERPLMTIDDLVDVYARRGQVDGALFANNPALCALTHALSVPAARRPQLLISIGTGQANRKLPLSRLKAWGAMRWLDPRPNLPLIDAMLDGQVDSVDHHLAAFFARDDGYFRFDPHLPETLLAMDDASPAAVAQLVALTERYLEDQAEQIAGAARRLTVQIEARAAAQTAAGRTGTA